MKKQNDKEIKIYVHPMLFLIIKVLQLVQFVDWISREKQFQQLCDKYRRKGNEYDCVIAVSSGKDSYYQIHMMKNKYNMNPLCANVDNSDWTQTGISNFENMLDVFNVDNFERHWFKVKKVMKCQ